MAAKKTNIDINLFKQLGREPTREEKLERIQQMRVENPDIFIRPDSVCNLTELKRPTGIMQLDIDLGGGFPAGTGTGVGGIPNTGKSFLMWLTIAYQQRIYGNSSAFAISCIEDQLPYHMARLAGCQIAVPDQLLSLWEERRKQDGLPSFTSKDIDHFKHQIGEFVVIQENDGDGYLKRTIDCMRSGIFNIAVIDSLSALNPSADVTKEIGETNKMGAQAYILKQFWNQLYPIVSRGTCPTSLLFTQQVVANQKKTEAASFMQKYIKDWTVKSGNAHKHGISNSLIMWSGAKIKGKVDGKEAVVGKTINYEIDKGKSGTHDNITGTYEFYYSPKVGIDCFSNVFDYAVQNSVVQVETGKKGGFRVHRSEDNAAIDGYSFKTQKEFKERLQLDVEFDLRVRREILKRYGKQCSYRLT